MDNVTVAQLRRVHLLVEQLSEEVEALGTSASGEEHLDCADMLALVTTLRMTKDRMVRRSMPSTLRAQWSRYWHGEGTEDKPNTQGDDENADQI